MKQHIVNGIPLTIFETTKAASEFVATCLLKTIAQHPHANLLVPTGTTPLMVYEILSQQKASLFTHVTLFNFDEYCEEVDHSIHTLSPNDPRSYHFFMKKYFCGKLSIAKNFFPDEKNIDMPGWYDSLIDQKGGIDLCLDAVGEDGHTFGFNMPASSFASVTRLVRINEKTQQVNTDLTGLPTPQLAISTGLATGMKAKQIIFMVVGKRKADIMKRILQSPISPALPATILRTHPYCLWVLDKEAASSL